MIKDPLEEDEHQRGEVKIEHEEKLTNDSVREENAEPQYIEVNEAENLFDLPETTFDAPEDSEISLSDEEIESIESFIKTANPTADFPETQQFNSPEILPVESTDENVRFEQPVESFNEQTADFESSVENSINSFKAEPSIKTAGETAGFELPAETKTEEPKSANNNGMLFQPLHEPESFAETTRKSGLAYAAAITLFASIVFMLIIGWFADLLFGSSPWGIVGGIILGSLIGFIQFFRMTAQIFKNKD